MIRNLILLVCLLPAFLASVPLALIVLGLVAAGLALYVLTIALAEALLLPLRVWRTEAWAGHLVREDTTT